jgi:hypothetical protein
VHTRPLGGADSHVCASSSARGASGSAAARSSADAGASSMYVSPAGLLSLGALSCAGADVRTRESARCSSRSARRTPRSAYDGGRARGSTGAVEICGRLSTRAGGGHGTYVADAEHAAREVGERPVEVERREVELRAEREEGRERAQRGGQRAPTEQVRRERGQQHERGAAHRRGERARTGTCGEDGRVLLAERLGRWRSAS